MTAFDEDPYLGGTRGPAAATPIEDRISEEKRMQWQVMVANQLGMARAQAFMAGAAERAAEDTFDPSWSPEEQATFKAEMWSGALSPMRVARRKASLPPEDAAAYDEHVAAINVGRNAYHAGAAEAKRLAEERLSWSGQVAAFGMGAASSLDIGGMLTKMLPELKDDLRKLHEMGGQYGQGQSAFGPRVQAGFEDRLIPPERRSDLFFKGASTAYGEALGASPWGARLGQALEGVGGLSAFVAGPGGAAVAGGKALLRGAATKVGLSKGAAGLLGVGGAAAGYGAYSAALPLSAEEQEAIDDIMERQGEGAANEAAIKLRGVKAGVAALMWPVFEITGAAAGRAMGQGYGQAAASGAAFSAIGSAEDLPQVREISEAIIGRDPGVRTGIGRLIMAYQDPDATPEDIANGWLDAATQVGVGVAGFSALHAARAWHGTRQAKGRQPDEGGFARTGRTTYDTAARDRIIEEILAKRARAQMREEAPELAGLPALRPVVAEAPDVRLPKLVGGGPMLTKEESLGRGVAPGVAQIEGPKETAPPAEAGKAAALPSEESPQSTAPTVSERREMLAQDEAKPPSGDVAKDAAARWRNDETRWITEQEPTPALAEYQREVDAYEGGEAPKRPSGEPPPAPAKPTEALPGVPLEEPPKDKASAPIKQPSSDAALEPQGTAVDLPAAQVKPSSKQKPGVYRPEETERAFDIKAGGRTFPVEVRPSDVMKGKVEVSIPSPTGEGPPYVVIARDVREGVTKIAEHWEGTVIPRSRLGEDVVKAAREKAAVERTEAQKKETRLKRAERILEERTKSIRAEKEARGEKRRESIASQRELFEKRRFGDPVEPAEGGTEERLSGFPLVEQIRRIGDALIGPGPKVDAGTRLAVTEKQWGKHRGFIRRLYTEWLADAERREGPTVAALSREYILSVNRDLDRVFRALQPFKRQFKPLTEKAQAIFEAADQPADPAAARARAIELAGPEAGAAIDALKRQFKLARRLIVKNHKKVTGKGGFNERIEGLNHGIAAAQESLAAARNAGRPTAKIEAKINAWYAERAKTVAERQAFRDSWGIKGGYMPHIFDFLQQGNPGFQQSHDRLVKRILPHGKTIPFRYERPRTGAEGFLKDPWIAATRYFPALFHKLYGERMLRKKHDLVVGEKWRVGKPYKDDVGETVDPLDRIQGKDVFYGPNPVKVVKIDPKTKDVTVKPVSDLDESNAETLPAARARSELRVYRNGLKALSPMGDEFMFNSYLRDVERFLRVQDRVFTSKIDEIVRDWSNLALQHVYTALLADPKVSVGNFVAGMMANISELGATYAFKGTVAAASAAKAAIAMKLGRKPSSKGRWALQILRQSGVLSDADLIEYKAGTKIPRAPGSVRGMVRNTYDTVAKVATSHFALTEKILRGSGTLGAYLRATESFGMTHKEAIHEGQIAAERTQWIYHPLLSPHFLQAPGAKFAFALNQVPIRLWNKLMETIAEAAALDRKEGRTVWHGIKHYGAGFGMAGSIKDRPRNWDKVFRFFAATGLITYSLAELLQGEDDDPGKGTVVTHYFGARLSDWAGISGQVGVPLDEMLDELEKLTGITREWWFIPGPMPDFFQGGIGVRVGQDVWQAVKSKEGDRWERLAEHLAPMVLSRWPIKIREMVTLEQDPKNEGRYITTFPGGKTKERGVDLAALWWETVAPGSPLRKLQKATQRRLAIDKAKRADELAEERNDIAEEEERAIMAGDYEKAKTLRARYDQLVELTGGETANATLARRERIRHWGPFERSFLSGPKQARYESLIRYVEGPGALLGTAETIEEEISHGGLETVKPETVDALDNAMRALRARTEKAKERVKVR